jgi:hypothetical protein
VLRTQQFGNFESAKRDLEERRVAAKELLEIVRGVVNPAIDAAKPDLKGERTEDEAGIHFRLHWTTSRPERVLRLTVHPNSGFFSWQFLCSDVLLDGRSMVDARAVEAQTVAHLVLGLFDERRWEKIIVYVRFKGGLELEVADAISWRIDRTDQTFFDITGQAVRRFPSEAVESCGYRLSVEDAKNVEVPLDLFSPWGRRRGSDVVGIAVGALAVGAIVVGAGIASGVAGEIKREYNEARLEDVIRRATT